MDSPLLPSTCRACAQPLSLHERYSGGFCSGMDCRRLRLQASRRAAFLAAVTQERDAAAAGSMAPDAPPAPVVLLKAHPTELVPVPAVWISRLRERLMGLQAEVDALADATNAPVSTADTQRPSGPPAEVQLLLGQLCAHCAGYCCRQGQPQYAFIDAVLLRRVWQQQPALSYAELVESYLAALPTRHLVQSCGFHGEHGCTLPRASRSDICNGFECAGFEQVQRQAEQAGVRRVYVVRRDGEAGLPGAFVPPLDGRAAVNPATPSADPRAAGG